jgi:hypothetical protein
MIVNQSLKELIDQFASQREKVLLIISCALTAPSFSSGEAWLQRGVRIGWAAGVFGSQSFLTIRSEVPSLQDEKRYSLE